MKAHQLTALVLALVAPAAAMKNRQRHFAEPCDVVWKAAVAVAKSHDYRIISIAKDEEIISLDVGGFWGGERIINLSLAPDPERGCIASVQSRFSGLAHSDGPDLLSRVGVEIIAESGNRDSKAFHRLERCVQGVTSDEKCEERYRREIAKEGPSSSDHQSTDPTKDWWKASKQ